jgi:hypothetical protein
MTLNLVKTSHHPKHLIIKMNFKTNKKKSQKLKEKQKLKI